MEVGGARREGVQEVEVGGANQEGVQEVDPMAEALQRPQVGQPRGHWF